MRDRIDTLIDYVARTESGGSYSAYNPDDNGHGLSWGLIQFNAQVGGLPELLQRMHSEAPVLFGQVFGWLADPLLNEKWVREDLNPRDPALRRRFDDAAKEEVFQQAQRDEAREGYFLPAWQAAQAAGLTSERSAALCFDAAVQHGVPWIEAHVQKAADGYPNNEKPPLENLAAMADAWRKGEDRRAKIMADPALSDSPFTPAAPAPPRTLQRGMEGEDVRELQRSLNELGWGVPDTGFFGNMTEDAVAAFQEQSGLEDDGVFGEHSRSALEKALSERGKAGQEA